MNFTEVMYQTITDTTPFEDTEYFKGYIEAETRAIEINEGNVYVEIKIKFTEKKEEKNDTKI